MFDVADLQLILKSNVALRLTQKDPKNCGDNEEGDAIPLSNLAGADYIIQFVSICCYLTQLSCSLEKKSELVAQLEGILTKYKDGEIPKIILEYKKIIENTAQTAQARLPKAEEDFLSSIYTLGEIPSLPYIFPLISSRTPVLCQKIVENFNDMFKCRLVTNQFFHRKMSTNYYLLLQQDRKKRDFTVASDLNRYPMGKSHRFNFSKKDIKTSFNFKYEVLQAERHAEQVMNWLKIQLPLLAVAVAATTKKRTLTLDTSNSCFYLLAMSQGLFALGLLLYCYSLRLGVPTIILGGALGLFYASRQQPGYDALSNQTKTTTEKDWKCSLNGAAITYP